MAGRGGEGGMRPAGPARGTRWTAFRRRFLIQWWPMIEMVTFHGDINEEYEFFTTVSGPEIHRRYYMKEDQRGLHFFSQANEVVITAEGLYYNCTGGQVSEYMFGATLPLQDILTEDVLNRLIMFGAYEDPKTHELYFTSKVAGSLNYETIFLNGNATSNYFFFVADPRRTLSVIEQQERTLKSLGKFLKRTEMIGRGEDTRLMEEFRVHLGEGRSDIILVRIGNKIVSRLYEDLRRHYRENRRLPDDIPGEERLDPYQKERLRIDIIYQDPANRSIIREYKSLLAQHRGKDLPPSIRARLQRLRTLSIKQNIPPTVFDTLEQIIFQGKKALEQVNEPEYITSSRQILEGFLLESGPFTHEISKDELICILFNKQKAVAERDNTFEEILLDVGRLIDEKVSQSEDFQLLEAFGAMVTYLDRFDSTASFINKLAFMDNVEMEESNVRSLLNNGRIFEELEAGLFDRLFFRPLRLNPYLPSYGAKKLEALSTGLTNIANNVATIQDICFVINEINREEEAFLTLHSLAKERLKHFYVDLNTLEGKVAFQREIQREMKKGASQVVFEEEVFQEVLRKIQLESFYVSQILPVVLESLDTRLREDFLRNSGLDRFLVEELEQEYFLMENLDSSLLAALQAAPAA